LAWQSTLQAGDGLGDRLRQEHHRIAGEAGIDDHGSWQTYGQLLQIHFWETVIQSRYSDETRPRGFVTNLENFVGEIVQFDRERVQKPRKLGKALRRPHHLSCRPTLNQTWSIA